MSGFLKFFGIHKTQNNPEAKISIERTAQQDQPPSLAPKDGTEDKIALLKTYLSAADLPHAFYALTEADEGQKIVMWVDWRDEDDGIVSCFEDILQTGSLEVEMNDTDDEIGFEIVISYKGERHKVPYQGKGADRDTTLVTLNEILTPDYEIRFCKHSDGSDTLAFLPLSAAQQRELENEFDNDRMNICFARAIQRIEAVWVANGHGGTHSTYSFFGTPVNNDKLSYTYDKARLFSTDGFDHPLLCSPEYYLQIRIAVLNDAASA